MDAQGRVVHAALELERLHNARRINGFRLAGLLFGLAVEVWFTLTAPGWIGAPVGLFMGWTVAAAALVVLGGRSERVARAASLAIPFVDMPLLYVLIVRIVEGLQAAGLDTDAARLSAHTAIYYVGLLVLASLVLDRWWLAVGTIVAVGCELALMYASGKVDTGVTVMTAAGMTFIGVMLDTPVAGDRVDRPSPTNGSGANASSATSLQVMRSSPSLQRSERPAGRET
jgi:hypothetical protein